MDSTIQPLLCCIGDATSVKPTQFLMERALAALHGDWRVITVEVQPDELRVAIEGLRAMKFTALRFFGELQQPAAQWLCANPLSTGLVTSAMRIEDHWTCWDNIGFGLLNLIQATCHNSPLVWLGDETRISQSLNDAINSKETGWRVLRQNTSKPDDMSMSTLQATIDSMQSKLDVVIIGDDVATAIDQLKQLQIPDETNLIIASNHSLGRSAIADAWQAGTITLLTQHDLAVAAEAYDFKRWTGKDVDLEQLRDAYDEYVDF